jgi:transposase
MSKVYRPYQPEQSELLPPSPREWLPEEHLSYFILDTVKEMDLKVLLEKYERELRGYPPYHPRMLVGLLLYGYCVGVASSRRLEKRTYEDVAFRIIAAGQHPDHTAIAEFRRRHLKELSGLFVQVLALCQKAGLVKLGHVALDGTKLKANASKHKAMSYERMQQREQELTQLLQRRQCGERHVLGNRCVPGHGEAEAWRRARAGEGQNAPGLESQGLDGAAAEDEERPGGVRTPKGGGGGTLWTNQAGERLSATAAARAGEGPRGVGAHLPDPQSAEALPSHGGRVAAGSLP